jgi:4-amino-4-deoxy-L-arabinose transferase-like glycosyltransferase
VSPRHAFARGPVAAAVMLQVLVLTVSSAGYGYHRDELYFRLLRPGWGYLDQPPLTPLLVRATRWLVADEVWALRIPATLAAAASVLLIVGITREVGGDRTAQTLAAWGYAFASFPLVLGHVLLTSSIDEPIWLGVLLLIIRAVLRGQDRWWFYAGAVVGLGLYNKLLIVVLLAALVVGVLITGPRRLLVHPPVLAAAGLALLVGLPNVLYQALNGWPQLEFGRQLAAHNSASVRTGMWPLLVLLLGPPLVAVWLAGVVAIWRRPQWRPIRFLAAALPVLLALVFILGSQPYYEFGLLSALFAVGCVPTAGWLARGRRGRLITVAVLGGVNAAVSAVIALPLVPIADLGRTPVPAINQAVGDTIGWPVYVRQVAGAYRSLAVADQTHAAVVASNYGEAGALDRYGPTWHLPHTYSAQNQLYFQGRPPDTSTIAIVVGGQADQAKRLFSTCRQTGQLNNGRAVDNEEQHEPILICRHPIGGWGAVWPALKHED